jgi:hypothetical protein
MPTARRFLKDAKTHQTIQKINTSTLWKNSMTAVGGRTDSAQQARPAFPAH